MQVLLAPLLLLSAVAPAAAAATPPPEDGTPLDPSVAAATRFAAARERLLAGDLLAAAAELEAISADPSAGELAHRAATLAALARDLAARGRFVPTAPALPAPAGPADRGGRAELVLFSTLYGVYAGGATVMAADVQNGRLIASLLLAGGGAGLGTSLWLTRSGPISSGRADAVNSAALWAGFNGTVIGVLGDANFRVAAGLSLASSAAGLTTAALLTRGAAPPAGTIASANSGGLWGLVAGVFVTNLTPWFGEPKPALATLLATADAGLLLGTYLGEHHRASRQRTYLIDAGAVVGVLGGLAVSAIIGEDSRELTGALGLAGLGAGLGTAVWVTRDWDAVEESVARAPPALQYGPWVAPLADGNLAWGVSGRF